MFKLFKILYANVNSYSPKKHLINYTLEDRNINCALFVETKTKPDSNTTYRDWVVIQRNGNIVNQNVRGGSLIQVSPNLRPRKANPPAVNNPLNEISHFAIPFQKDFLHIFLCYIHPTSAIEESLFTKAALYKYSLIIGDLNINRFKAKQIKTFRDNSLFLQAATPATFIMANNPDSTPDIILYSKNLHSNIASIQTVPDISSDHLGFEVTIDLLAPIPEDNQYKINLAKCKMEVVNQKMRNFMYNHEETTITENFITEFNDRLSQTILEESPKVKIKHYITELPPYIIRLIKNKRKMYREYIELRNPEFKRHLNEYNKNIQTLIRKFRETKWINTCKSIEQQQGKNYWQQIKKVTKYKTQLSIPDLEINGHLTNDDTKKSTAFAEYFSQTYLIDYSPEYDEENFDYINNWHNQYFSVPDDEPVEEITEATYFGIINTGKSTSPGYDYVTKKILRDLDIQVHKKIIQIFNFCLQKKIFPEVWKKGQIITIPKPNADHSQVCNYRPITLLPVIGKVLEIILKQRIQEHINNHIPVYQFGFREKRSTTLPVSIMVSNIQAAKLSGQRSAAVFLDISKAFDSVWHTGILYKLWKLNCPKYLIHIVRMFLINRTLQIKIKNTISSPFTALQGVPQGSPLSPVLYNIFCHDIYNHSQIQPNYFNSQLYALQFADDTALLAHNTTLNNTINSLQQLLENTTTWFKLWRLKPNPNKSQFVIFNHLIKQTSPSIFLNNHTIRAQPSAKYLGITIDQKLNFNQHTKAIKSKCTTRAKHFRSLTYKNQGISTLTASHIYKSICRPLLEYCHPLYLNCRRPAIKNLETAERTALRSITRIRHPQNPLHNPSNELLYQATQVEPIMNRIKHLSTKFSRVLENRNILTRLCNRDQPANSRHIHPDKTLFEEILRL